MIKIQIQIEPDSTPMTAFSTEYVLFVFVFFPLEIDNATETFIYLINTVFLGKLNKFVNI